MKDKWIIFIILGILIVFLIFQQYLIRNSEPSTDEKLLQKIEVLEKKIGGVI